MTKPQLVQSSILESDFFINGKVRLYKVINSYKSGAIGEDKLIQIYKKWREQKEYFVLREWKNGTLGKPKAFKCSKRGNDVYRWRINQRFKEIDELAEFYGDSKLFDVNRADPKTNCLFVTFSYDTKLTDKESAWIKISEEYNRAITALRKKFGKITVLRVWEAFKNGYPHIHAIMLFEKKKFDVFEHWTSNNKSTYRIKDKSDFENTWHSFVDVMAVDSVKGALRYISKYLRKVHSEGSKHEFTLANMWIHRKQSFAVSGAFYEQLKTIRLDMCDLHNSNRITYQTDLEGQKIKRNFVFVGIFTLDEIRRTNPSIPRDSKEWVLRLKNLPEKKSRSDEDVRIQRELRDANKGISITNKNREASSKFLNEIGICEMRSDENREVESKFLKKPISLGNGFCWTQIIIHICEQYG